MARVGERRVRAAIGTAVAAAAVAAAALSAVALAAPPPAGAGGGDWLYPHRDRYDAGHQVLLVGYTEAIARSTSDDSVLAKAALRGDGPYYAYLRVDPAAVERTAPGDGSPWPYIHPTDRRMTQVTAEEVSPVTPAASRYFSLRVSASFRLPRELAPAIYQVIVCNDPCTTTLGYLVGSSLYVGIDPAEPIVREWPLDDPAIRHLDDGALVAAPVCEADCDDMGDWTVTAAEIRAGYRPTPITAPREPEPAVTSTAAPLASRPIADAGTSPAGRAGADPAGGVPSEVVAWLLAFGALLVVWCLAWRWRPREARMVVRPGNGQHDHVESDDDPDPVHIKL
jgi:hypothetical protein